MVVLDAEIKRRALEASNALTRSGALRAVYVFAADTYYGAVAKRSGI